MEGLWIAHFGLLIFCSRSLLCSQLDLFSMDCLFSSKSQTFMIYFLILDLRATDCSDFLVVVWAWRHWKGSSLVDLQFGSGECDHVLLCIHRLIDVWW